VLHQAKCFDILNEPKPEDDERSDAWNEKAATALYIISLSVTPIHHIYIQDCTNGYDAWNILTKLYEKPSQAKRVKLKRAFYTCQHNTSHPVAAFIESILSLANQLRGIGVKLDDDDLIDCILFNLNDAWSNISGSLITAESLTLEQTMNAILDEGQRRENTLNEVANQVQTKWKGKPLHMACYACGKTGHLQRDCRHLKKVKELAEADSDSDTETSKKGKEKVVHVGQVQAGLPDIAY
jgi:hypothetical protein